MIESWAWFEIWLFWWQGWGITGENCSTFPSLTVLSRKQGSCLFSQNESTEEHGKYSTPVFIIVIVDFPDVLGVTSWYYLLFTSVSISDMILQSFPPFSVPQICIIAQKLHVPQKFKITHFLKLLDTNFELINSNNAFIF